jgi:hypothetical protein
MRTSAHEATPFQGGARWRSVGASLALRLRVYATRPWLDRQITAGVYAPTCALELRAHQLTCARTRHKLARELRGLVEYAERTESRPVFSAVVIDRRSVIRGRTAILGLAERLETDDPVTPTGIALVRRFLTDGLGPLFNRSSQHTVIQVAWNINDALEVVERDPLSP